MATMEYAVVTEKGLALQAKLNVGSTMTFTKFVTGAGTVSPVLLQKQTEVTDEKQEYLFSDQPYYSEEYPGEVVITMIMNNVNATAGYNCGQIGIYAKDTDEGDILYAILQTDTPFKVPLPEENGGWSAEFEVTLKYGGAEAVNIYVNAAGMLTRQAADNRYMQKIKYGGKIYTFVRDEKGVYLEEADDTSGEATDVFSISDADMAVLHELFVDTEELAKALENVASKVTVNGVEPDENGEITLGASDVGARPVDWMPTASDVGALKVYTSLSQLGLVEATATAEAIVKAMNNNSMLIYSSEGNATTSALALPHNYGLVRVIKLNNSYAEFHYQGLSISNDSKTVGMPYVGYYNDDSSAYDKWTGWINLADASKFLPIGATASDVGAFPNSAGSGTIDGTTTSPFHTPPGHYNVVPGISTAYNWPADDNTNLNGTLLVFGKLNQPSANKGYRVYVYFDNKHRFYYACEWWGNVPTWKNVYSENSITAGTTSLTAGTSALTTGHIYQVYE